MGWLVELLALSHVGSYMLQLTKVFRGIWVIRVTFGNLRMVSGRWGDMLSSNV